MLSSLFIFLLQRHIYVGRLEVPLFWVGLGMIACVVSLWAARCGVGWTCRFDVYYCGLMFGVVLVA